MRSALVWLSATALAIVFAWAALAKAIRFGDWRKALAAYGFSGAGATVAAPAVPLAEATVAAVLAAVSVKVGAAMSLVLLAGFSYAIVRARAQQGSRLPCGCFGKTKARDYRLMLARNGALVLLAAVVTLSRESEGLLSGMEVPAAGDVLPAVLALTGVLLLGVVLWQSASAMSGSVRAAGPGKERSRPHRTEGSS